MSFITIKYCIVYQMSKEIHSSLSEGLSILMERLEKNKEIYSS